MAPIWIFITEQGEGIGIGGIVGMWWIVGLWWMGRRWWMVFQMIRWRLNLSFPQTPMCIRVRLRINRLCSIASRTVANAGVRRIVVHRIHWSKVRLLLLPWIVRVLIHLLLRWRAIIGWNLNWALDIN